MRRCLGCFKPQGSRKAGTNGDSSSENGTEPPDERNKTGTKEDLSSEKGTDPPEEGNKSGAKEQSSSEKGTDPPEEGNKAGTKEDSSSEKGTDPLEGSKAGTKGDLDSENVEDPMNNVAVPPKDVAESLKNVEDPSKDVVESLKNVEDPSKNIAEDLSKNVAEPSKNVEDPSKNVVEEPSKNVAEPSKNVEGPQKNVAEPLNNVEEPSKNGSKGDGKGRKEACSSNTSFLIFSYHDLMVATDNFRDENCLGSSGQVFKGHLRSIGRLVVVRHLHESKFLRKEEFFAKAKALSLLDHPNIVRVIGCCADDGHRLLVSEYVPLAGSLDDLLHDLRKHPLNWSTRIKIAIGAAEGLVHIHRGVNPPIIYGELKASDVLLGEGFHPKLSDSGFARFLSAQDGEIRDINSAYLAPEYAMSGCASLKSDVYSFGVLLLEMMTGHRPINDTRAQQISYSSERTETISVQRARKRLCLKAHVELMADLRLRHRFPIPALSQVLEGAFLCIQEDADKRVVIEDVCALLNFTTVQTYDPDAPPRSCIHPYRNVAFDDEVKNMKRRMEGQVEKAPEEGVKAVEPPRKDGIVDEGASHEAKGPLTKATVLKELPVKEHRRKLQIRDF